MLREMENKLQVKGLLKTKELSEQTTRSGVEAVIGTVTIEWNDGKHVNNTHLNVFVSKYKKDGSESKLYKSIKTVMDEYKDIDTYGRKEADYIQVSGSVDANEYYDDNGQLHSFNRYRALFFNRVDKDKVYEDGTVAGKAIATIESVITNYVEEINTEQEPTGNLNVKAFTVGYNNVVIPLFNVVVDKKLVDEFRNLYIENSTGKLTYKLNNYAESSEKPDTTVAEAHGFGSIEKVADSTFTTYVSNMEIIGGDIPEDNGMEYSPEDIKEAEDSHQKALSLLQMTDNTAIKFGNANAKTKDVDISDDDLPF